MSFGQRSQNSHGQRTRRAYIGRINEELNIFVAAGHFRCSRNDFLKFQQQFVFSEIAFQLFPHRTNGGIDIASGSIVCLLYTSPSPRDQRGTRMPSSA